MEEKIYLEKEFEGFLLTIQQLKEKTVKAYLGTFRKNLSLIKEFENKNVKNIIETHDFSSLSKICYPIYQSDFGIAKGTYENFITHSNRYRQFLVFQMEQNLADLKFDDSEEEYILSDFEDLIIEEKDYDIEEKVIFDKSTILDKFKFRLITQNRFNKCGLFYPISFLKQYFYKNGEKVYFDKQIEKQIDSIKLFYEENKFCKFSDVNKIKKNNENRLFFDAIDKKNIPFLSYCSNKKQYEYFIIENFSDIAIDHVISMNTILNEAKNDFQELKKISNELKKYLNRPVTYKKIIAKGTKLSNDLIFTNKINKKKLKSEFEIMLNKMDLQLMHKKHNNFKRAKD